MSNSNYQLADFKEERTALDEIHQLEQKLSEQYGSHIVLIAYTDDKNEAVPQ